LAKGFADGVTEYKEIVTRLHRHGVLNRDETELMYKMAGYRNRLVHLYHEVTELELYQICTDHRNEMLLICNIYQRWLEEHPEKVERKL
jgi:uncharacterized protein YutE (UPF0331/DUF86 family)